MIAAPLTPFEVYFTVVIDTAAYLIDLVKRLKECSGGIPAVILFYKPTPYATALQVHACLIEELRSLSIRVGMELDASAINAVLTLVCLYGTYKVIKSNLVMRRLKRTTRAFPWFFFSFFVKIQDSLCPQSNRYYAPRETATDRVSGGPPSTAGFHRWNGKEFYRYSDGSSVAARMTGGKHVPATHHANGSLRTAATDEMIWEKVPEEVAIEPYSPGECALNGLLSNASPARLLKGGVLAFDTLLNHFSSGAVIMNMLIMCRHGLSNLSHLVIKGSNLRNGVRIATDRAKLLDSYGAPKWDETKHTCSVLDFVAIPLTKDEISGIGVKSLQEKDLSRLYELQRATIAFAKDDFGNILQEEGSIPEALQTVHDQGIAMANIVSRKGASSSPVMAVQSGDKCIGLWQGEPTRTLAGLKGTHNQFLTMDAILANLTLMGLYQPPMLTRIRDWSSSLCSEEPEVAVAAPPAAPVETPGESRETKRERAMRAANEYYEARADEEGEWWADYAEDAHHQDEELKHKEQEAATLYVKPRKSDRASVELRSTKYAGHGKTKKVINAPLYKLATAGPATELSPPLAGNQGPGESIGEDAAEVPVDPRIAIRIALEHNTLDLNDKVRSWKYGVLQGHADEVLQDISYFAEEASGNVRERLVAGMDVRSNALLKDYVSKVEPEWFEKGTFPDTLPVDERVILDGHGEPLYTRVGTTGASRVPKPKKEASEESVLQAKLKALAEHYTSTEKHGCKKGQYKIPMCSKQNIDRSLRSQAALVACTPAPLTSEQQEDLQKAIALARSKYGEGLGEKHIKTYLEEGELGFLKTFVSYEDKSSGASARYRIAKKQAWVREHPEEVVDLALSRLILIAIAGEQIKELSAIELVKYGLADVKDIFMKPEGHSPAKRREGRFRLIWISSLIDITVQSLLHKADNAAHTEAYQNGTLHCAALGMGHSDAGIERLVTAFKAEGVDVHNISSDASAFDLSITGEFIRADGDRRSDNCENMDVANLVRRYSHILCRHVLNNNGDVWVVNKDGVTTSGQLSTTTQNTFARSVMAAYAGCLGWVCAGDDLVGDENFDYLRLEHFGVRSRDVEPHVDEANFTSHLIDMEACTAVFMNVEKMLWHLYDTCVDTHNNKDRFGGCLYVLRSTPGVLEDLREIVHDVELDVSGFCVDSSFLRDMA
jgi:hypothetical protein